MTESQCSFENEPDSPNEYLEETCIFCTIASGDDPYTEILAEDEDIVCFKDINPGAPHHYLVIPKKHIHSCLSLQADDISLVKRMAEMGRDLLKAQGVTDFEDIRFPRASIYHRPPPALACSCTFQSNVYMVRGKVYKLLVPHRGEDTSQTDNEKSDDRKRT